LGPFYLGLGCRCAAARGPDRPAGPGRGRGAGSRGPVRPVLRHRWRGAVVGRPGQPAGARVAGGQTALVQATERHLSARRQLHDPGGSGGRGDLRPAPGRSSRPQSTDPRGVPDRRRRRAGRERTARQPSTHDL
jgi:hypothetical protein